MTSAVERLEPREQLPADAPRAEHEHALAGEARAAAVVPRPAGRRRRTASTMPRCIARMSPTASSAVDASCTWTALRRRDRSAGSPRPRRSRGSGSARARSAGRRAPRARPPGPCTAGRAGRPGRGRHPIRAATRGVRPSSSSGSSRCRIAAVGTTTRITDYSAAFGALRLGLRRDLRLFGELLVAVLAPDAERQRDADRGEHGGEEHHVAPVRQVDQRSDRGRADRGADRLREREECRCTRRGAGGWARGSTGRQSR